MSIGGLVYLSQRVPSLFNDISFVLIGERVLGFMILPRKLWRLLELGCLDHPIVLKLCQIEGRFKGEKYKDKGPRKRQRTFIGNRNPLIQRAGRGPIGVCPKG